MVDFVGGLGHYLLPFLPLLGSDEAAVGTGETLQQVITVVAPGSMAVPR